MPRGTNIGQTRTGAQSAPNSSISKSDQELAESYASTQKNILEIQEKIKNLSSMTFQSERARAEQAKKIAEYTELLNEGLESNKKIEQDILENLKEQDKVETNIVKLVRQRYENTKETEDLSKKITKSLRDQKIEFAGISDAGKALTSNLIDGEMSVMSVSTTFGKTFQTIAVDAKQLLDSGINLSDDFMDNLQETEKIRGEYRDLEMEFAKNAEKAAQGKYDVEAAALELSKQTLKLDQAKAALDDKAAYLANNMATMDSDQIAALNEEIRLENEMIKSRELGLNGLREQHKVLTETAKTAEKTLGVFDKITSGDFKGALLQKFGLDDINKQLKEKVGGALVSIVDKVKKGDLSGAFSSAGEGLKSLTKLAGAFTLALGIGAIFKLGSFLLETFMEADKEVSELGKNFGISKDEAKELHHTAVDVANEMGVVGVHSEEIAKGLKNVSENLGGIDLTGAFNSGNAAVQQMVKDSTLLTEKFGLSAEEAGNMSNIAAITGKSVGEMSMMATKLGDGMFSAKESMKILAGIPKSVVSQMSKMPEAMIKTAMHAKALGMNMKQIADIGRKSLDIEQSLENEMEARALLGKDINLDKMRAAALDGDQETVMNELLNAAGSMKDFNNMNVIQKEALAKAAGMEVDQLAEMLGKQEELNAAGITQNRLKELTAMNEAQLAEEIAKGGSEEKKRFLEKLQAEKKSESTQAAMASLMKRMQELAVKLVTPIMDVLDGLLQGKDGADAMGGVLNVIGGIVKGIVPVISSIATTIGWIVKPLTWILGLFSSTEESTDAVAETTGKVADGVSKVSAAVKPVEAGFGSVLGAVTAIGAAFAGKALIGKGLSLLKDKALDLGSTLISKVGGPLGKLGSKLMGRGAASSATEAVGGAGVESAAAGEAEKGKNIVSGILDKIKAIIDSIKGVVQSAIGFVRDVGKDLLGTLKDLIQGIGDILATGADIVVNVGSKLAEGAMKILNIIMKGLAEAAATLPGIMGSLGSAVVAFFTPMAALIAPPVLAGIAVFVGAVLGLGFAFKMLGEGIGAAAPGITAFFDGVGGVIQKVGEAIAKVIDTITTSVIRLQDIDGGKMTAAAFGITAIAGALAAFGGGSAIAGLGSALGKLFDEDPVDKFNRFASINAAGLQSVATAINTLGQAIQNFSNISGGLNLDKVDEMISKLEDLKSAQTSAAISDLATTGISAVTSFVGNLFGSSEEQSAKPVTAGGSSPSVAGGGGTNMANVEKKLDTLISVISQAANQPTVIKFGEKTVEEIKSQLNFKKAYAIGIDNTYGRSI